MSLCIAGLLLAAAAQWLLSSVRFSSGNAEWVFRGLYLGAHLAGLGLSILMGKRVAGRRPVMVVLLAPAILCVGLQWQAVSGRDGQDAILLLALPVLQVLAVGVAAAIAAMLLARGRR